MVTFPFSYFVTDNDWNPIEWDRAAEELTVERVSTIKKKSCRSFCETLAIVKLSHKVAKLSLCNILLLFCSYWASTVL